MIRSTPMFCVLAIFGGTAAAEPVSLSPYGLLRPVPADVPPSKIGTPSASARHLATPPAAVPRSPALDTLTYRLMARQEAERAGVPFDLVDAVMKVESDYDPTRIGDVGEIGLMQVRPGTAAMLGFRGDAGALADPAVNIHYGSTYLGVAWHLSKGNVCRALMKYRAGHGEEAMSALSVTYCSRAKAHLVAINSPLAATIKSADLVATVPDLVARPAIGGGRARSDSSFWRKFEARIRRLDAQVQSKWRRRMASR